MFENTLKIGMYAILSVLVLGGNVAFAGYVLNSTGGDCSMIGTWDALSSTCTLNTDVVSTSGSVVRITNDGVTLDCDGYTLDGKHSTSYTYSAGVELNYGSNGVTVRNCVINDSYYGIYGYYPNSLSIINNEVIGQLTPYGYPVSYYGISAYGATNALIQDNTVSGAYYVIYAPSNSGSVIEGNTLSTAYYYSIYATGYGLTISDNVVDESTPLSSYVDGIYVQPYSPFPQTVIEGNVISNVPDTGLWVGGSSALVQNNYVENSGIGIQVSSQSELVNNTAVNNGDDFLYDSQFCAGLSIVGMQVTPGKEFLFSEDSVHLTGGAYSDVILCTADGSLVEKSAIDDMYVADSSNVTIQKNDIGAQGVRAYNTNSVTITRNDVTGAGKGYGIKTLYSNQPLVEKNKVDGFQYGLYMENNQAGKVWLNVVSDSVNYGMYFGGQTLGTNITNNTVTGSHLYGIRASSLYLSEITKNIISGPSYAIYIQSAFGDTISKNTISNAAYGMYLRLVSGSTIEYNTVSDSANYGVYLRQSSDNSVGKNSVCGSSALDIYSISSYSNTGEKNTCDTSSGWADVGYYGCTYTCS